MAEISRHEDFTAQIGKSFHFAGWNGVLRLAQVDISQSPGMPGESRAPFSLIFHGVRGDILPEGLYDVAVEHGPRFTFYVMPIHTPAPDRQEYQAVFN